MPRVLAEILCAPVLVGCASAAGRRWGARAAGLISAFPAVVGPVLLISAQEHGLAFAARAANGTMLGLGSLGAFAVTYSRSASRARWSVSLLLASGAAAAVAVTLGWVAGSWGFPAGPVVAIISLSLARAAMPAAGPRGRESHPTSRGQDALLPRMLLTAALVAGLAGLAGLVGPFIGGLLAALPVLASVLAVFTHRHEGSWAAGRLLAGMLTGMAGFVGFCAVIAVLIVPGGPILAFACATGVAVALQLMLLLVSGLRRERCPGAELDTPFEGYESTVAP
jgi:hypothetical protein